MSAVKGSQIFGKRPSSKPILILANGDKVRHMTVSPWMSAAAVCVIGVFSIGYLAATSYLVFRDDLIGGTMARQARIQHEYEDRISALRAQVDRVTSRQLLDQQVVEDKVEKLLQQQMALSSRHGQLGTLLERAEQSGLATEPAGKPAIEPQAFEQHSDARGAGVQAIERLIGLSGATPSKAPALAYAAPSASTAQESMSDRADRLFSKVTLSLKDIEHEQKSRIESLTEGAAETAANIEKILARTGIKLESAPETADASAAEDETAATGGPFVEPETTDAFDRSLVALDSALARLEHVRKTAKALPFDNPSPASEITSRFGNRADPFLGRLAMHTGIDFAVRSGTDVRATAPGVVTTATRNGGYGNMVEIDHGNGISTRYAHLSTILVNVGDRISKDEIVARSGSTGRSTGPHLHYEVRINGDAVDPMRFLNAGLKLGTYIN